MSLPRDDKWLAAAERIDALRVIPRILCFGYGILYWVAFFWLVGWAMEYDYDSLKNPTIAMAIIALPASLLTILGAIVASMTKDYWSGGRKWDSKQNGG